MARKKGGPMTAQRVSDAMIAERKQKPCAKCGSADHAYLNKSGKRGCEKEDKHLSSEQRELWEQHELNPRNDDATIEARLAVANADVETPGQPLVQPLPVRTVPGSQAPLRQGQLVASAGPAYRGLGSSVRRESKERPSKSDVPSKEFAKPGLSGEHHRANTLVPSKGTLIDKNEGEGEEKKKKERDTISWQRTDDNSGTVGLADIQSTDVDDETHKKAGRAAHAANATGAGVRDIHYQPENRWQPRGMPGGAKVYDHKDLRGPNPATKTAIMAKALQTQEILEGEDKFPARPNHGTKGDSTTIVTNYLRITDIPSYLHNYAVKMMDADNREVTTREQRRYAFSLLAKSDEFRSVSPYWATDLSTFIVSRVDIFNTDKGNPNPAILGQQMLYVVPPYQFKIGYNGVISTKVLQEYTTGKSDNRAYEYIIQALNAIMYRYPNGPLSSVQQIGINKFYLKDPTCDALLGRGLVAKRGYSTSIRAATQQTLLNINTATGAFFAEQSVAKFIQDWFGDTARTPLREQNIRFLGRILKGLKVRVTFSAPKDEKKATLIMDDSGERKQRRRRIMSAGEAATTLEFPYEGTEGTNGRITVKDFFSKVHGLRLEFPHLPCINLGGGRRKKKVVGGGQGKGKGKATSGGEEEWEQVPDVWMPAEFLEIEPNQPFSGKLDGGHTTNMLDKACRSPVRNAWFIREEGMKALGLEPNNNTLQTMGLGVDQGLLRIKARLLPALSVQYTERKTKKQVDVRTKWASWNLKEVRFAVPKSCAQIQVVLIEDDRMFALRRDEFTPWCADWASELHRMGLDNPGPSFKEAVQVRPGLTLDQDLKKHFNDMRQAKVRLAFVVLLSNDATVYSRVKRLGDSEIGILTVCATIDKLYNPRINTNDLQANLAMKINMKLGGVNHALPQTKRKELLGKDGRVNTMVVGADVTHPSRQSVEGCPSIAAVVASIDEHFTNYPGSMRLQDSKVELIAELHEMLCERLLAWQHANGHLPERILFYRDGVADTQYASVKANELPQIVEACKAAARASHPGRGPIPDYKPFITLVIVGKRHQTRFFPIDEKDCWTTTKEVKDNLKPGLVVDTDITSMWHFDFYLQSHCALKGTARSAHYFVIHNGIGYDADTLQDLTNSLCYTFPRATKGVSYVAAAYMADRLCERGRMYLKGCLDGTVDVVAAPAVGQSLEEAMVTRLRADPIYWRAEGSSGVNPWHKDLDGVMFWL